MIPIHEFPVKGEAFIKGFRSCGKAVLGSGETQEGSLVGSI